MQQLGQYQVLGELGRGGMGVVLRAVDPAIGRTVALKVIRLEGDDPTQLAFLRDRLFREARSAGNLSHPGIVTVYQVAEQDGVPYIAMEFVDGATLEKLLSTGEPPPRAFALKVIRQAAAALDYAHKKGVIHRDIKPANVMIDREGVVKICDFGVAKVFGAQTTTQTGMTLGTPFYMSPEQIEARPLDGRSDQFSLAVMAYQMLAGQRPFQADTLTSLLFMILHKDPPPVEQWNPALGGPVNTVLRMGLSKDANGRFQTCTEFAEALENACALATTPRSAVPAPVPQPAPVIVPPPPPHPPPHAPVTPVVSQPPRSRLLLPLMMALGLLLVGGCALLFIYLQRSRTSPVSTSVERGQPNPPSSTPEAPARETVPPVAAAPAKVSPRTTAEPRPPSASAPAPAPASVPEAIPAKLASLPPQWSTFRGNPQRTGLAPVRGPREPYVQWRAELGGQLRGSPAIGPEGRVYIGSNDHNLYAVESGSRVWSAMAGAAIEGAPIIQKNGAIRVRIEGGGHFCAAPDGAGAPCAPANGLVDDQAAQSPDGRIFYAEGAELRQLGDSRWRVDLHDPASTSPAIDQRGRIYVGTTAGTMFCIDDTGKVRWTFRAPVRITAAPALSADGDVIFGCADRNLYCLRDGELRWKFATRGPIYSAPVVDRSNTIYFGSNDGLLYAVNDAGEEVWKLNLQNEIRSSPAFDRAGRLYVASVGRWLYCISDRGAPATRY